MPDNEPDLTDNELRQARDLLRPRRDDKRCEQLWACYQTEQMSEAQWQGHLREEPGLRAWVSEFTR